MNQAELDALMNSAKAGGSPASVPTDIVDPGLPSAFDTMFSESQTHGEVPLAMLLDLTLPVSIELGRTTMTVRDILRLGRGSVVQLERLAGEPIDIYVGDRRFAEGEVVVLGEHFGVRVTRVLSAGTPVPASVS
ncbi:N/A [soil metagenome]|jgi:flagellar motor switch protein FliN/FliY